MAVNFKDEAEVKLYLHNLGIEYRFGCYHEKKPEVCHLLADYLEAIKKDFEKASLVFKSNCDDHNFAKSCYKYGGYCLVGRGMKEADVEQGYKYLLKSCELGDSGGCLSAGMMNVSRGTFKRKDSDPKLGVTLLEKCCEGNIGFCCYFLSGMYIVGAEDAQLKKDMSKAFKYALKGCELGEYFACANLSQMYRKGDGVKKNEELAEKYKKMAQEMQDDLAKKKAALEFQQGI